MSFYPAKVSERFKNPQNVGKAAGANGDGTSASFICGAFVRVSLKIEIKTKEILEAKFKTNGCGFTIASADVLTEKINGEKLTELHGLDREILRARIENELGKFPENRRHCLDICIDALHSAFADFRAFCIEEFTGDKALICACFGVSEETIENAIKENSPETVEEVTVICNAGGGCGSCQPLIQEILDVLKEENYDIIERY